MEIRLWTVAADDDCGTRATVHLSEKAAYEQWLLWQFPGQFNEDEEVERAAAACFIDREDYAGLWTWKDDNGIGEAMNTYAIEEHLINIGN